MPERRKALGRGLSALLPTNADVPSTIPVNEIAYNPQQPRKAMDEDALARLAESVEQHGVLQPIVVTPITPPLPTGEKYRLIVGERRLRACMMAGLQRIPAVVREVESDQYLEMALIENVQREDLNPIEEAEAYQELIARFGLTQEQVAQRVSKSRSTVANSLRLLNLPSDLLDAVRDGRLSEGHARAILGLPTTEQQKQVAATVIDRGLSVRETERLVKKLQQVGMAAQERRVQQPSDSVTSTLEDQLRSHLGTKVTIKRNKRGRGTIVIHFYSDEELDAILQMISRD